MNNFLLILLAAAALTFAGCADNLISNEKDERGPAPYSPDPMSHVPVYENNNPLRGPTS